MQTENYVRGGTQKSVYSELETCTWACPICGSTEEKFIKSERGALKVVSCEKCNLMRINPRLKNPDEIYRGEKTIYEQEFRLIVSGQAPHHRDSNYLRDLKLIEHYKPTGNFLDIGTNTGSFLRLARNRGWNLTGVEPSPQLAALARKWWDLSIVEGFIETVVLPAHHFDVVTMTDVFEHVVNPQEVLKAIRRVLKPDGILFIKVPNGKFNLLKFYGRRLLGTKNANDFDSYEHVAHYSDETLKKILTTSGFDPIKVSVESPVQTPVWHHYVGQYYQHKTPFILGWKIYAGRNILYWLSLLENLVTRRVGWLAPNIGCFARPAAN